jgi:N-methylhydantoinase B
MTGIQEAPMQARVADPITVEVIGSLVMAVAEEMGVALIKTAFSPNIKERGDCSTAIFDATGQVVAQAPRIPIHLGSMLGTIEEIVRRHPLESMAPGDVIIANDPYFGGGSQLPDINFVSPVFDGDRVYAYVANIAHHSDIGGMVAGSESADCRNIYQEGLRIPPVKLVRGGVFDQDILNLILTNSRTPRDRIGDIRAQVAANRTGVRGLEDIRRKYGTDGVLTNMAELLDYAERRIRVAISSLPDGTYEYEDWLDSDGISDTPVRTHVALTIQDDHMEFDFGGTDPQVGSARNVPFHALASTVYTVVKCMVDADLPGNSGYFRAIKISAPKGSFVNPVEPAAVGVRSLSCGIIGDVVAGALSKAMPERALASSGPHAQILPSGIDRRTGEFFVDYETLAGAYGARPYHDGLDAVRIHASGASNLPVEALEHAFPLRIERYELRQDSGGVGTFRGGMGIRRDYRILGPSTIALSGERQKVPARGLEGGGDGAVGAYVLNLGTDREKHLPSTVAAYPLEEGDLLTILTPGGGGYGLSAARARSKVESDVKDERVSLESSVRDYGLSPGIGGQ